MSEKDTPATDAEKMQSLVKALLEAQREVQVQRQVCAEQLAEIAELKARSVRAEHANRGMSEESKKLKAELDEARTVEAARKVIAQDAQRRRAKQAPKKEGAK